jgi:AraC-like DNA-binding protein/mannose-6-phosphate isomerase-like protein (cupin superfamily)
MTMRKDSNSVPLLALVQEKLIPWAQHGAERLVLARMKQSALRLPKAVSATAAKPLGKKRTARGRKVYNHHIVMEQWPEEGQETLRVPMLWCVVAGELQLRLGGYYLNLQPGYAVLIPPGVPHPSGVQYDYPNKFCDVFIISPRGRQMQCWITEHRNGNVQQTQNVSVLNAMLADDLDRIVEEISGSGINSRVIACHLLSAIWLTLERELRQKRFVEILPSVSNAPKPALHDPIFMAKQYIQAHLHQELTLQNVAQAVHLSRTQFIVLFRQQTGQSFVEYLTELRLEWACQLLRETGWTVHHICTFIGFKAPAYFHRLFRRKTGMTPIQYRQAANSPQNEK